MEKFAVRIDLSTFFDDERKLVLILINPDWKNVRKLQKRLDEIFQVGDVRFLTSDGYFVPPEEPIEVIKFADKLKAIIHYDCGKIESSKIESLVASSKNKETLIPIVSRKNKRKFVSLESGFASSTPNQCKRSKCTAAICTEEETNATASTNHTVKVQQPIANSETLMSVVNDVDSRNDKTNRERSKNIEKNISNNDLYAKDASIKVQKNKTKTAGKISHQKSKSQICKDKSKTDNFSKKNSHTYFDDSMETSIVSTINNEDDMIQMVQSQILFRCALSSINMNTPRTFPTNASQVKNNTIANGQVDANSTKVNETLRQLENKQSINDARTDPKETSILNSDVQYKSTNRVRIEIIDDRLLNTSENCGISSIDKIAGENSSANEPNELTCTKTTVEDNKINETVRISLDDKYMTEDVSSIQQSKLDELSVIELDDYDDDVRNDTRRTDSSGESSDIINLEETDDEIQEINDQRSILDEAEIKLSTLDHSFSKNLQLSIAQLLTRAKELSTLPDVGDILLFKLIRPGSKRLLTEYISGICSHINRRLKSIKISVLESTENMEMLTLKYSCNLDDSKENKKYLMVKMTDLLEAKVLKTES